MIEAVGFQNATGLQILLVILFCMAFGWIAFPAVAASYAILERSVPRFASQSSAGEPIGGRTAIIMPVYNEDPNRTFSALRAMAEGLVDLRHGEDFEIFVLSDTSNPDIWLRETQAYDALATALRGRMKVFYRRRHNNRAKKPGNVQDFVERWGARYRYMVVLDADSLMAPATLARLAREMDSDRQLGLLQTVPRLAGGRTLFARMQQFASCIYGELVADGVAAWQGDDGNFWGHNAIIRIEAFADACGLPQLPGRPPLGGHIMSHDFVEAAFLRRAGWKVRTDPRLSGSWEEPPPTIPDFVARDRRWAQGNLQHSKILTARGLTPVSRLHMIIGIMSYMSSLNWLMLILLGLGIAVQARFITPEYFPENFQLFPNWPSFDSQRLVWLFVATMLVLTLPKMLSVLSLILSPRNRKALGGGTALLSGFLLEVLFSGLVAPVMMLSQTRQILEIATGRSVRWSVQQREDGRSNLADSWKFHKAQVLIGGLIGGTAWTIAPNVFAWLSPIVAGLCLAPIFAWAANSRVAGEAFARLGLFRTFEEISEPSLFAARLKAQRWIQRQIAPSADLSAVLDNPRALKVHISATLPRPNDPPGNPDAARLVAERKIEQAACRHDALSWLTPSERLIVLAEPSLLLRLAALART
jgi:membrane glycosyltransferase